MKNKLFLPWLAALASCLALAGCGGGGSDDTANNPDNPGGSDYSTRIYMLVAESGQLAPAPGAENGDTHVLVLNQPVANAFWYTDRPSRETGATAVGEYVDTVWGQAYGQLNPNATLQFQLPGNTDFDDVYAALSNPAYDEQAGTLTFQARVLNTSLDDLPGAALAFGEATLNVLNNVEDDQEVSSYVQYAGQAALQAGAASGTYTLTLENAGPDMLWVDNAPGTYSDSRPMSDFFMQWGRVFGDDPPNAALFGHTGDGQSRLYFVTLADPVYDKAQAKVSYTATLLDQNDAAPPATLSQVVLSIDSGKFLRFPGQGKGTAYQAFGGVRGQVPDNVRYDPSTANNSYIYFGSDIARSQFGSLWGKESHLKESCAPYCRNDLQKIKDLGINLIRLYDWDTRNDHSQFLDYANKLGIKVIVPISNWLPTNPQFWDASIPEYLKPGNFGNAAGNDWHPAIAGVIITNELDMSGTAYQDVVPSFVLRFLEEAERKGFSKSVLVGAPVSFALPPDTSSWPQVPGHPGRSLPGWKWFDLLVNDSRLAKYRDQLMLNPNTYNDRHYLFDDAAGLGAGWVPLTYQKFGLPILFTEIGLSRTEGYFTPSFIRDQLQGALQYQAQHPEQLLGAVHFQFDNKVWMQSADPGHETVSEGAFGMFRHGAVLKTMTTVQEDYPGLYIHEAHPNYGSFVIDQLDPVPATYDQVVQAYQ